MTEPLAIEGGAPVRREMLPYGRQTIDEDDIAAVSSVLRSEYLTTGPEVDRFEAEFAKRTRSGNAVALSSGTAALHASMAALGVGAGDEVIVPALTFAATANTVVMAGGTPVFADVDASTLLLSPESVADLVTPRTKAVVAVDYAGQPCDYETLREAAGVGIHFVADACHSLGATRDGRPVGTLAELSAFSLHPVKHVTSGEGGVVTTSDARLAERMRRFRNHGISVDHRQRSAAGSWLYEIDSLGYNYRLTDFQAALGASQLRKLDASLDRRQRIAERYRSAFADVRGVTPLPAAAGVGHAYHLFVVRIDPSILAGGRDRFFAAMRAEGIGVNVHYVPVHLHPFYRREFGTAEGDCPAAEAAYGEILTLPMFPGMTDSDVSDVIAATRRIADAYVL